MIKFTADTSAVKTELEKLKQNAESVSSSMSSVKSSETVPKIDIPKAEIPKMEVEPTFDLSFMDDACAEASGKFSGGLTKGLGNSVSTEALSGLSTAVKGLGAVGIALAVAKGAIDGFKKAFEFAKSMTKVYDPIGTDRIMSKMNASISKMKSAIGKMLMPTFEEMADFVGNIADGVTTVIEGIQTGVAFIQGLQSNSEWFAKNCEDAADALDEASEAADEGLASFDKLNTLGDLDVSGMEEAERIRKLQAEAYENGQKAAKSLEEIFTLGIPSALDSLGRRWSEDVADLGAQFDRLWDDFGSWGVSAWDGITDTVTTVSADIGKSLSGAWSSFTSEAGNLWTSIESEVGKVSANVGEGLAKGWGGLVSGASDIWTSIESVFTDIATDISEAVAKGWGGLVDGAKDVWKDVSESIGGIADNIKVFIENAVKDAFRNAGLGWVVDVADTVTEVADTVTDAVEESFHKAESGDLLGAMSGLSLNPTNPGDILGAVTDTIASTLSQTVNVTLDIDGRTLARETIDYFQSEANRIGGGIASFFGI